MTQKEIDAHYARMNEEIQSVTDEFQAKINAEKCRYQKQIHESDCKYGRIVAMVNGRIEKTDNVSEIKAYKCRKENLQRLYYSIMSKYKSLYLLEITNMDKELREKKKQIRSKYKLEDATIND